MATELTVYMVDKEAETHSYLMQEYFRMKGSFNATVKGFTSQDEGLEAIQNDGADGIEVALCGVLGNALRQFSGETPWASFRMEDYINRIKQAKPGILVGIYSSVFSDAYAREQGADFYLDKTEQFKHVGGTFRFDQMVRELAEQRGLTD